MTPRYQTGPKQPGRGYSASTTGMPEKTKNPAPIRPEHGEQLTEILRDRRVDIRLLPPDEAAAHRDSGFGGSCQPCCLDVSTT